MENQAVSGIQSLMESGLGTPGFIGQLSKMLPRSSRSGTMRLLLKMIDFLSTGENLMVSHSRNCLLSDASDLIG
jgi:hypothetical protein